LPHTYRYLIVIDDIWDTEPWEIIRCALPENGLESKIITTTRIIDVAEHVGGCYKLKSLTHHNSKELFYIDAYLAPKASVLNNFLKYLKIL
jgi:disease resistance protein RPM1